VLRENWNLLREDLSLPAAVLVEEHLLHNLAWMQRFIDEYRVSLAPHGKTTMAPRLFEMQIQAGAWGITVATAQQARVAAEHGVRRVLMANQLVGRLNMAVIAWLQRDPEFEFYCLVDSAALIDLLGTFFFEAGQRLRVLIELGVEGGRAGIRDEGELELILAAIARWKGTLALCGIEVYEGVLKEEGPVRDLLRRAVHTVERLSADNHFEAGEILLTGAGSEWYDVVAEEFSAIRLPHRHSRFHSIVHTSSPSAPCTVRIVLRPGCYITHDVGAYSKAQERILQSNPVARDLRQGLRPALQVWAYVQSLPETGRAIIGMGKRDAAFDSGLPAPALHFRPRGDWSEENTPVPAPIHWSITKMMDQHAFLDGCRPHELKVGDMIGFNISHPCLTFDKWRTLPIVNAGFQVVDIVETFF
jgi:D-serine dehydratase